MLPKVKIVEVFEELSPQDNGYWEVPDGVYEVEFALVAGGLNGGYSDIYNAGSGGNGGGVLTGTIPVNPGVTYRVVVGDIGGDSIFGIYQAIAGKGGNHGGGDGAGVEDTEGVIINGKNGGNATYYGGGGGGASKASSYGAAGGRGGSGYRGIVILHYLKMDDMNRYDIIRELGSYFDIVELVCPHTYNKWKDRSWQFLDTAFLHNLLILRRDIIKQPMYCNNWDKQGQFSQRGLRCNICQIVKDKKDVYLSAHVLGKAGDFDVKSMTAEQARGLILDHQDMLPYPFRLEGKVNWLHFDSLDTRNGIHAVVF